MSKKKLCSSIGIVVLVAAVGCAPPAARESSEIAAGAEAWGAAFTARDIDALVALYTDDARIMPPNAPAAQGRDAVAEEFQAMFDADLSVTIETTEAMSAGDLGHRVGTFTLSAGGAEVDRGKYIETWRKVGGEWKITADIYNSDWPAPGMAGTLLIGTHEVEDAEHWLQAWRGEGSRHEEFAGHGAPMVKNFQSQQNPNLTAVLIQVEDMAALEAFLSSPMGEAAKAADGVKDETLQIFLEVE